MELNKQLISANTFGLKKLFTPSILVFLLIVLFSLITFKLQMKWINNPFYSDVNQYYSYLIAQFIHHDFSFRFTHDFWLIQSPDGEVVPKVTMGMAALYFPFFMLGNAIAHVFNFDQSGYSAPYAWTVHFGTLVYVFVGFWYLRKTLLLFFSEWVCAITLFLILFATNLFYYTFKEGEMAHSYLFFLFTLFIYNTILWHNTKKPKHLYILSFILGLIALIRPSEIIIVLVFIFYQVGSFKDLSLKIKEIISLKWKLILALFVFILPIIPQLFFWKQYTGHYLFFSYGDSEHFFFNDPKIYSVLFGWHKGWFIYTPLAVFMITGLVMMFFKWKKLFFSIAIYLAVNIYLISCWWDWGFGGAYGMRALVQCYSLLAIPLACFIAYLFTIKKQSLRITFTTACFVLFSFFISINGFHLWLAKNSIFHWDSMSKQAYMYTFFKTSYTEAEWAHLGTLLKHPNYKAMRNGIRDEN